MVIIGETAARDDILHPLDVWRRDQMPRLNSYVLVTPDDPKEILTVPALFKNDSAFELVTGMKTSRYVSDYSNVTLQEFLKEVSGPAQTGYLPIVSMNTNGRKRTEIVGTAVFHGPKMVGHLDSEESLGLLWLLNQVHGSSVGILDPATGRPVQLEVTESHVRIQSEVHGQAVSVQLLLSVRGTMANTPPGLRYTSKTLAGLETQFGKEVLRQINRTMEKLQKQYRADLIGIGLRIYRHDPAAWHRLARGWDTAFGKADVQMRVRVQIYHQGLINRNRGTMEPKSGYAPYPVLPSFSE